MNYKSADASPGVVIAYLRAEALAFPCYAVLASM